MNSEWKTLPCLFVLFASLEIAVAQNLPPIQPIAFQLPDPPQLKGTLSVNQALRSAEKVHQNKINGPSSFVSHKGGLYVGTVDNKIYDIASCTPRLVATLSPQGCNSMHTCGQLTSLRLDPVTEDLLALVNFVGLMQVDPMLGNMTQIYSAQTPINGRAPVYLTDLVAFQDGTVIMADASDAYAYPNDIYICLDSRPRGRLLAVIRGSGVTTELLPNTFVHPTSLELSVDGTSILVSEACRARIRKVSLQQASLLDVTDFSLNLPGLPDNIRATKRGTYWVAMRLSRHSTLRRNPLDFYSQLPNYRYQGTQWETRQQLENYWSTWSMIVELNQNGQPIGSLHDPQGSTIINPTTAREVGGVLYIGSDKLPYASRIVLPETEGRKIKIDSFIQVLRSRCVLDDKDVAAFRQRLVRMYPNLQ